MVFKDVDRIKAFSYSAIAIGILLMVSGFVVPQLSFPASYTRSGPPPSVKFSQSNPEWTEVFEIPAVHAPATIHIVATKSGSGNVTIQVTSYAYRTNPESFVFLLTNSQPAINTNLVLDYSVPYLFFVTSENSTYSLTVSGNWEAYGYFNTNIYIGGVFVLAGIVSFYFHRLVQQRERVYRKALEEAGIKINNGATK